MEAALDERLTRPRWKPGASARAAPRVRYEIRSPRPRPSLLGRLRDRLRRREHELLATWPGRDERSDRRTFEPPLRSPLQVWRVDEQGSRVLGAVGSGFLVLGVSLHESGVDFETLRAESRSPERGQPSSKPCESA